MFVVYNTSYPNYKPRYFDTKRGAHIAKYRQNAKSGYSHCDVLSLADFNKLFANKKVLVKSLMTGAMVEILESERGTANDPSQERFWSM